MAEEVAKNGVMNEGFSETDIDKVSDTTSVNQSVIEGCQILKSSIQTNKELKISASERSCKVRANRIIQFNLY